MLDTLREYAERQAGPEERSVLEQRHAEFFLQFAEQAAREIRGPRQTVWLESLDEEYDNLRKALEWTLGSRKRPKRLTA